MRHCFNFSLFLWIPIRIGQGFTVDVNNLRFGSKIAVKGEKGNDEPDLFEYFDPLLSPHAYPKGISPETKPVKGEKLEQQAVTKEKRVFGFQTPLPVLERPKTENDSFALNDELSFFDPTISPHAYPRGTPDVISYKTDLPGSVKNDKRVLGILLMDHGSRNPASNKRLHELAKLYQDSLASSSSSSSATTVVVRAAHMEIASPTIPEVLKTLLVDDGADEIVCHPYFLSPGRHVQEDIPRIVSEAMQSLREECGEVANVPLAITDPVGSITEVMLRAIHSLVQEKSTISIRERL